MPVDGVVLEGESAVDEAMLTGESVPADKKSGSELFAGTVNLNGRLVMRVTATGETTALAHIIAAVQRAQTSRADIQRLGDRISNVFVPVISSLHPRLRAGIFWAIHSGAEKAFVIAAGILIVACPCAMGLATPAAIMASANAAARRGILIRDGVALEKAGKITAVIFDKTGTLTDGQTGSGGRTRNSEFRIQNSEFWRRRWRGIPPIPSARRLPKFPRRKSHLRTGRKSAEAGVSATLQPSTFNVQLGNVRLGSLRWLKESGVDLAAGEKFIAEWSEQGATIVGLASDKTLLGLFAVRDAVKPNAATSRRTTPAAGFENFSASPATIL